MKKSTFRPDLTDYLPYTHGGHKLRFFKRGQRNLLPWALYIEALTDKLNEESILKMSRTDAVKIAIELACKNVLPDVRVEKKRKLYLTLKM